MKHRRSDHTAFVDRNHVFDIDEGIRFDRGVLLDQYESLCNQISDIVLLPLPVKYTVANIFVAAVVDVQDRKQLAKVRNEVISSSRSRSDKSL